MRVLKSVPGVNIADNPEHLCQRLVDELLAHHQENKVTLDGILHKELKLMCHRGQHPSLDLLLVASRIFQVGIFVFFWSKQAVIDQFENYDRVVHLQCVSGIHVNPLSELRNYVPPNSNDCNIIDVETTVSKNPLMHDDDVSEVEEEVLQNLLVINETKCCDHKLSSQPSVFIAVNDHNFCAVLDTGAEMNLVCYDVIETMQRSFDVEICKEQQCSVSEYSGIEIPISQTLRLKFAIGNCTIDVPQLLG